MGAKAPPAPDYAAANVAGAQANAQVLPMQIGVDRAARAGQTYTDPETGKTYNFDGMGDAQLNALDAANTERLMKSGADIQRELTKGQYQDLVDLLPKYNQLNLESQRAAYDASLDASKRGTANQYDQNLEYQPKFGELQRSENEKAFNQNLDLSEQGTRRQTDLQKELLPQLNDLQRSQSAIDYRQNLDLGEEGTRRQAELTKELTPGLNDLQRDQAAMDYRWNMNLGDEGARRNIQLQSELLPQLNNLLRGEEATSYRQNLGLAREGAKSYADTQRDLMPQLNQTGLDAQMQSLRASTAAEAELNPERDALRRGAGKVLLEELQAPGLTDLQKQDMEQQMRGAQAARGNILGAGAGFDEAQQITRAGEAARQGRRQLALQFLQTPDLSPKFNTAGAAPLSMTGPNTVNQPGVATGTPGYQSNAQVNTPMPNYQSTGAVNPLMPNYGATQTLNPQQPSFAATTTGGPNLNPVNINQSQGFNYVDRNAGDKGASYAKDVWNTEVQQAQQGFQNKLGLAGAGLSAVSMFM